MIYLYGLFEGHRSDLVQAIAGARGLQGPLEICSADPWFLVFSEHDDAEVLPKRRHMLAHTHVLERMIAAGTTLPARFGLVADDAARAVALIQAQHDLVRSEFERLRGHVEIGIRVSFPREAALETTLREDMKLRAERDKLAGKGPEAHFAIAEFGGRLAEKLDRRRGAAQRTLLDALKPVFADHVLRKPEEDNEVLRAEFLVSEENQDRLIASVEAKAATLEFAPGAEPEIQIIGPVPMYNFVNLSLTFDTDAMAV